MQAIRIGFIDFWPSFQPEEFLFTKLIKKQFNIIITNEQPDYIFCSNFGKDFLKYKCPRIYYSGEAVAPDFNVYDYAIGFDSISFGDRYLRFPLCLMDAALLQLALHKHENPEQKLRSKTDFCSFVVSADGGPGNRRDSLFDLVSTYKRVDSGGRHRNNLPNGEGVPNKLDFQKNYKFCLTCENSSFPGYATEKIIDAFAAGAIPIYWGDPNIVRSFNPNSFINCLNMKTDDELIQRIREIDNDDELYLKMLSEPMLSTDSDLIPMMEESYLLDFFSQIFLQTPIASLRRNSAYTRNGQYHEHDIFRLNKLDTNPLLRNMKKIKRDLFGSKKL